MIFPFSLNFDSLTPTAVGLSLGIFPLAMLYPLAKRYTHYAQTVLGVCFNSGIFIGAAQAMGPAVSAAALLKVAPFYLGCIAWTMIYDTIYAYGDREDDMKQGMKGLAVLWGDETIEKCQKLNFAKVGLFSLTGVLMNFSWPYYLGVAALGVANHSWVSGIDLNDRSTYQRFFDNNRRYALFVIALIILGKLTASQKPEGKEKGSKTEK